jgi:hypothetical protein
MRKRAGLPESAVLAVVAGVLVLALPSPAHAAFPGQNGRIAFTVGPRDRGELLSSTIETVLPSGQGRRRVHGTCPSGGCFETFPDWSPSGRRLVFPGEGGLFTARTDGTRVRRVTSKPPIFQPAWSQTGITAFASGDGIYTVRPEGSRLRLLVRDRYTSTTTSTWPTRPPERTGG